MVRRETTTYWTVTVPAGTPLPSGRVFAEETTWKKCKGTRLVHNGNTRVKTPCRTMNPASVMVCRGCYRTLRKPVKGPAPSLVSQLRDAEKQHKGWLAKLSRATTGVRTSSQKVSVLRTQVAVESAVLQERRRAQAVQQAGRAIVVRPDREEVTS